MLKFLPVACLCALFMVAYAVGPLGAGFADTLRRHEPVITVAPVGGPIDGEVRGEIEIAAPPSVVWDVLSECARAGEFMPNLRQCRILESGPGLDWDIREHRVASWASFLPDLRSVFRSEYEPGRRIVFRGLDGDLAHFDGEWRIAPIEGGQSSRVTYEARVGFHALVPGFLVRRSLERDVPVFLKTIQAEAERRAAL